MDKQHIAKVFMNGRSQAVRLPKEFRFTEDVVFIRKEGDEVILSPRPRSWDGFFNEAPLASTDFMTERVDLPPQKRKNLI
ncbi:MAG: antitoxin [Proteobacteria bacterium]|nr:antitoxin [Pseudomonadota bacterium]